MLENNVKKARDPFVRFNYLNAKFPAEEVGTNYRVTLMPVNGLVTTYGYVDPAATFNNTIVTTPDEFSSTIDMTNETLKTLDKALKIKELQYSVGKSINDIVFRYFESILGITRDRTISELSDNMFGIIRNGIYKMAVDYMGGNETAELNDCFRRYNIIYYNISDIYNIIKNSCDFINNEFVIKPDALPNVTASATKICTDTAYNYSSFVSKITELVCRNYGREVLEEACKDLGIDRVHSDAEYFYINSIFHEQSANDMRMIYEMTEFVLCNSITRLKTNLYEINRIIRNNGIVLDANILEDKNLGNRTVYDF